MPQYEPRQKDDAELVSFGEALLRITEVADRQTRATHIDSARIIELAMYYYHGLSINDAAIKAGLKPATVASWIRRGRELLDSGMEMAEGAMDDLCFRLAQAMDRARAERRYDLVKDLRWHSKYDYRATIHALNLEGDEYRVDETIHVSLTTEQVNSMNEEELRAVIEGKVIQKALPLPKDENEPA